MAHTTRKISFWKLLWTRLKHESFYKMFHNLSLEQEEKKDIVRTIIRTFVKSVMVFLAIETPLWIWYYINKHSAALKGIMIITPISVIILIIIGYISRKMLKGFNTYRKNINDMTSGGGIYDGLDNAFDW